MILKFHPNFGVGDRKLEIKFGPPYHSPLIHIHSPNDYGHLTSGAPILFGMVFLFGGGKSEGLRFLYA
jgi:hypothetical protein